MAQDQRSPEKSKNTERTIDIMFILGLVLLMVGLGFSVGWGWGLAAAGVVLIGTSLWMVAPAPKKGGE